MFLYSGPVTHRVPNAHVQGNRARHLDLACLNLIQPFFPWLWFLGITVCLPDESTCKIDHDIFCFLSVHACIREQPFIAYVLQAAKIEQERNQGDLYIEASR